MGIQLGQGLDRLRPASSAFVADARLANAQRYRENTPFGQVDYISKEDFEREIVGRFLKQFTACRNFRAGYYDLMWAEEDKSFYGVKPKLRASDKEKGFRSNLKIRHAYKQVQSQTAKIVPSLLGFNPPVSVRPNDHNSEWAELKAKAIQDDLQYEFLQKQNAVSIATRWIEQGERTGISPLKLRWAYEEGTKIFRQPMYDQSGNLLGMARFEGENYVIKDMAENQNVDCRRFWWNPDATDPEQDWRYAFEEYYKPLSYFQNNPLFINTNKLVGMNEGLYGPQGSYYRDGSYYRTGVDKYVDTGENMVRVVQRWDPFWLLEVAENQLIRYRDNPYGFLPYYIYRSTLVDDSFVGMGCIEPVLDLEDEANTHLNQRLDNVHRLVHKQLFAGFGAGLKQRRLTFVPGGVHQVRDINQLKWFEVGDVTASSYLEEDRAVKRMDDINGDPEVGRGEGPSQRQTATEVQARVTGSSFRIDLKANLAMVELARQYRDRYELNKIFKDPNRIIQVQGQTGQWFRWRQHELYTDEPMFDFTLGGYLGNRMIDFQQFVNGLQVLSTMPQLMALLDSKQVLKVFLERSNIHGTDRFMRKMPLPAPGYNRDPYDENRRMALGDTIVVLPGENHAEHIPVHMMLYDMPQFPQAMRAIVEMHIAAHIQLFYQSQTPAPMPTAQQPLLGGPPAPTNTQEMALTAATGQTGITPGGANAA